MTALDYPIGLAEAWAEHLARQKARHPNAALKGMFDREAGIEDLLSEMNKVFAVVKYGHGTMLPTVRIAGRRLVPKGRLTECSPKHPTESADLPSSQQN